MQYKAEKHSCFFSLAGTVQIPKETKVTQKRFSEDTGGRSKGKALGTRTPFRSNLFHFYAVFGKKIDQTRMHSSRMRTGHSLTVCRSLLPRGRCLLRGGCLLPGGMFAPGGCLLRGGGGGRLLGGCLLWGVSALGGVCSVGRCLLLGGVVSHHALRQTPPVDRITDACKNITLAQLRCGR